MRTTEINENRREHIKRFICLTNIGKENEAFRIDFDNLVKFLMQAPTIRFAASEYEVLLTRELESKVLNKILTPADMNSISDYIWDLAEYCTVLMNEKDKKQGDLMHSRASAKHEIAERLRSGKLH
jgi:hypothetical protein